MSSDEKEPLLGKLKDPNNFKAAGRIFITYALQYLLQVGFRHCGNKYRRSKDSISMLSYFGSCVTSRLLSTKQEAHRAISLKSLTASSQKIPIVFSCRWQSPSLFLPTNKLLSKIFLRRLNFTTILITTLDDWACAIHF